MVPEPVRYGEIGCRDRGAWLGYFPGALPGGLVCVASGPSDATGARRLTYRAFRWTEAQSAAGEQALDVAGVEIVPDLDRARRASVAPGTEILAKTVQSELADGETIVGALPSSDASQLFAVRRGNDDALRVYASWLEDADTAVVIPASLVVPPECLEIAATETPAATARGDEHGPGIHGLEKTPQARRPLPQPRRASVLIGSALALAIAVVGVKKLRQIWPINAEPPGPGAAAGSGGPGKTPDKSPDEPDTAGGKPGSTGTKSDSGEPDRFGHRRDAEEEIAELATIRSQVEDASPRTSAEWQVLLGRATSLEKRLVVAVNQREARALATSVAGSLDGATRDEAAVRQLKTEWLDGNKRSAAEWMAIGARAEALFGKVADDGLRSDAARITLGAAANAGGRTGVCPYLKAIKNPTDTELRIFRSLNGCS